jgi:hypothetical protein
MCDDGSIPRGPRGRIPNEQNDEELDPRVAPPDVSVATPGTTAEESPGSSTPAERTERPTGRCPHCRDIRPVTNAGRLYRHDALQQVSMRASHKRRFRCPAMTDPTIGVGEAAARAPRLEHADVLLIERELDELERRCADANDPHPLMTRLWAGKAIQQLRAARAPREPLEPSLRNGSVTVAACGRCALAGTTRSTGSRTISDRGATTFNRRPPSPERRSPTYWCW